MTLALDHGEIAHPAQQRIGDAGRAARTQRHLVGGIVVYRDVENAGRAADYPCQHGRIVIFQVALYAEARPQGRGQQTAAGRSTDKRKGCQLDLNRPRRRPLVQHDVYLVVLHRRIEVLLHDGAQPMDFVDEQHVARTEVGEQTRQVARLVEHRTRSNPQLRPHLVGDDVGQRSLAQPRRAVQEHVVERIAPHERRLDEDAQILDDLVLPREVFKLLGADFVLEFEVALGIAYDRHRY